MSCTGFVVQELLPLAGIERSVFMLGDFALLLLGVCTMRDRRALWATAVLIVLSLVSTIFINHESWLNFINGSRDFIAVLVCWPAAMFLLSCKEGPKFKKSFDRQLFIFLIIQAFCVTEQFFRYGPGDHGGGSLGNNNSGIISTLIILISYYLVKDNFDPEHYLQSIVRNKWKFILLFPTMLNETKISFIFIAVYLILLYKPTLRQAGKLAMALPVIALFFVGIFKVYSLLTYHDDKDVASVEYLTDYLFSSEVDGVDVIEDAQIIQEMTMEMDGTMETAELPRFVKFMLMPSILEPTAGGQIFGAGLGHMKGGTSVKYTKFALENAWLIRGTLTMLMFLYIQLGILGLAWFFWTMWMFLDFKHRAGRRALATKLFLAFCIILLMFYDASFRFCQLCIPFFYIMATTSVQPGEPDPDAVGEAKPVTA